jgi:hypothetical protein
VSASETQRQHTNEQASREASRIFFELEQRHFARFPREDSEDSERQRGKQGQQGHGGLCVLREPDVGLVRGERRRAHFAGAGVVFSVLCGLPSAPRSKGAARLERNSR